jgi:hypothetical protein
MSYMDYGERSANEFTTGTDAYWKVRRSEEERRRGKQTRYSVQGNPATKSPAIYPGIYGARLDAALINPTHITLLRF